jgi:hypothetical protein
MDATQQEVCLAEEQPEPDNTPPSPGAPRSRLGLTAQPLGTRTAAKQSELTRSHTARSGMALGHPGAQGARNRTASPPACRGLVAEGLEPTI